MAEEVVCLTHLRVVPAEQLSACVFLFDAALPGVFCALQSP